IISTGRPVPTIARGNRPRLPCRVGEKARISPTSIAENKVGEIDPGRVCDGRRMQDRASTRGVGAPWFGSAAPARTEAGRRLGPGQPVRVLDRDPPGRTGVPAVLEPPVLDSLRPLAGRLRSDRGGEEMVAR